MTKFDGNFLHCSAQIFPTKMNQDLQKNPFIEMSGNFFPS